MLKAKIKKKLQKILNKASYLVLILKGKLLYGARSQKTVAIFADYLDVSFLLSSAELKNEKIIFFCTSRYPFLQLFRTGMYSRIQKLVIVKDYAENQYAYLEEQCKLNDVRVVLIQAGDFLVPAYNYINRVLGAKANSELAVKCSLDKGEMREMLNKHRISPFKTVDLVSREDVGKVNFFPCVLKPKIGTFSEGVVLLQTREDFDKFIDESERQRRKTEFETGYIIEEYIEGRQFDVEGIIHNGKLIILSVVEESYTGFFPYFNINWFFFNAFISDEIYQKMYDTIQAAFEACGMSHGAYHCELRLDSRGDVRILEFSNRMGGGFEEPITRVTGNSFADVYVSSMLGKLTDTYFENQNKYLLQKYFQFQQEVAEWEAFLRNEGIEYQFKTLSYRGHVGMMNIYHSDKEIMLKIADKFNLVYKVSL